MEDEMIKNIIYSLKQDLDKGVIKISNLWNRLKEEKYENYALFQIMTGLYNELDEKDKDKFLDEMLSEDKLHDDAFPYATYVWFEDVRNKREELRKEVKESIIIEEPEEKKEEEVIPEEEPKKEVEDDEEEKIIDTYTTDEIVPGFAPVEEAKEIVEITDKDTKSEGLIEIEEEGPAIKKYKEETDAMERKLEELEKLSNGASGEENSGTNNEEEPKDDFDKFLEEASRANDMKEGYEAGEKEFEEKGNTLEDYDGAVQRLKREKVENNKRLFAINERINAISEKAKEIIVPSNRIEYEKEIASLTEERRNIFLKNKDIDTQIEMFEGMKKDHIAEMKEMDRNTITKTHVTNAEKNAVYVDADMLRNACMDEINNLNDTLNRMAELRDKFVNLEEGKARENIPFELLQDSEYAVRLNDLKQAIMTESMNLNGIAGSFNINSEENREKFKGLIDALKEAREYNKKTNKKLTEQFEPEKTNSVISSPNKEVDELKSIIAHRKENIEKYEVLKNAIKSFNEKKKSGLEITPEKEQEIVNNIEKRIAEIDDPSLQEELRGYLGKEKKKGEEGKEEIVEVENVKKNPKKTWKTFASLATGLAIGGVLGFTLTPVGIVITNIALAGAKIGVNRLKKEAERRRLSGEVTTIEEPSGKIKAAIHRFKEKLISNEELLRDISWGLTGGLIGLNVGVILKNAGVFGKSNNVSEYARKPIEGTNSASQAVNNTSISGEVATTNNIPQIGDSVNGIKTGFKTSLDAASNSNAVSLNQAILGDGNTVVGGYGVNGNLVTNLAPGQVPDSILLTDGTANGYRAWVTLDDAAKAIGSAGKVM